MECLIGVDDDEDLRKKRRLIPKKDLKDGQKVEVRSTEDGFDGSWHPATIVPYHDVLFYCVSYDHLIDEDGSTSLTDFFLVPQVIPGNRAELYSRGFIRPIPPLFEINRWVLAYGLCVDALVNDAWWEGVIFDQEDGLDERLILFPDLGDQQVIQVENLRVTHDWDEAQQSWKFRGLWIFLELIEKHEQELPVVVSVRQLWYNVRLKEVFQRRIKEWTFWQRPLWDEVVLEAICESLNLNVEHALNVIKSILPKNESKKRKIQDEEAEFSLASVEPCGEISYEYEAKFTKSRVKLWKTCASSEIDSVVHLRQLYDRMEDDSCFSGSYSDDSERIQDSKHSYPTTCELKSKSKGHVAYKGSLSGNRGNRDILNIKRKSKLSEVNYTWSRVGPNILPRAACCPEALSKFLLVTNKDGNYTDAVLKARMHLSYLGWTIESKSDTNRDMVRFRYSTPQKKAWFYSLRQVCIFLTNNAGNTQTQNSQNPPENMVCLPVEFLVSKAQNRASPETPEITEPRSQGGENGHFTSKPDVILKLSKQSKRSNTSTKNECIVSNYCSHAVGSYLESREDKVQSIASHTPRTILSWLISNNVLKPRTNVTYMSMEEPFCALRGRITSNGIECNCCQRVYNITSFEAHAGSTSDQPSAHIFLEDGRSLLECQGQLLPKKMFGSFTVEPHWRIKAQQIYEKSDYKCSICHYGGDLILCDQCPSAFHLHCVGLQNLPEGTWFCQSCRCGSCGQSDFNRNTEQFTKNTVVYCDQCEREYHLGCVNKWQRNLDMAKRNWFCSRQCEKIFVGLNNLVGKPIPVDDDKLFWTILKFSQEDLDTATLVEYNSKLNLALNILHECFEPVEELNTDDIVRDVIFNKRAKLNRLHFQGFYTVLLEREDEMISVAAVRVLGEKVAEVPLVGTSVQFREHGMCRILMNTLEKKLKELGVQKVVLPAAPQVLQAWTKSFGYSKMTHSESLELLGYTFLNFQGTTMCKKKLKLISVQDSARSGENHDSSKYTLSQSKKNSNLQIIGAGHCTTVEELSEQVAPCVALNGELIPISGSLLTAVESKQDKISYKRKWNILNDNMR